ncbi:MAG: hypothetical protein WD009_00330 [Phycisphaeraceae bacterium]
MFRYSYIQHDPRLRAWHARLQGRPGWVWKATVLAAVMVVVLPLIILTLTAVTVAAAVFAVASLVASGVGVVRRLLGGARGSVWPADDGRRNVRVIDRGS